MLVLSVISIQEAYALIVKEYLLRPIEHGTVTPLVIGTNGAMGRECQLFHKKLAEKLSQKQNKKYHEVITDIRAKISFKNY